jgi:DNA-directed RNA polymerase specialized sigma24 family protein
MTGYDDFEEFVVARRAALLRTAYLLTGNHHDAEDLVQSALIKVVPKWKRIRNSPEAYVRQVLAR